MTILHYAVPSPMTGALRDAARRARAAVSQRHARVLLRAVRRRHRRDGGGRTQGGGRRSWAASIWRSASPSTTGKSSRTSGSSLPACCRSRSISRRLRSARPVPSIERTLQDGLANILFVGRIAPNKKIEDHIRLAEHFKRYVDTQYRFIFVGREDAVPHYYATVRALIAEYKMLPERFWFTGAVPDDELAAYYRHAHAYVSLSEHEGFCAPLVEAMAMDVPVLAYAAAAVPETLGGAGVCVRAEGSRTRRRMARGARLRRAAPA